jgi:hypothetical protein
MGGTNEREVLHQWRLAKQLLPAQDVSSEPFPPFWTGVGPHLAPVVACESRFARLFRLAGVVLTVLLQTADCERVFSRRKHIMAPGHEHLSSESSSDLVTCAPLGPSGGDVDPAPLVDVWLAAGTRDKARSECGRTLSWSSSSRRKRPSPVRTARRRLEARTGR